MKDDSLQPWIEPELEARIVALVVDEASDFETEELERLIEEKPELGLFRERMEALHGMLKSNGKTEPISDAEDWKLSAEKRASVLSVIQGAPSVDPEIADGRSNTTRKRSWKGIVKIAAMVALSAVVLGAAGGTLFFSLASSEHSASSSYGAGDRTESFNSALLESTSVVAQNDELSRLEKDANGASWFGASVDGSGEVAVVNDNFDRPTAVSDSVDDIVSVSATSSFSVSNVDVQDSNVAVDTGVSLDPSMSLGMPTLSSLDVDSVDFLKYEGTRNLRDAQIGHGGSSAEIDASGQSSLTRSNGTIAAGGELQLQQDGADLSDAAPKSASVSQMNNERHRVNYYDAAYDHTRAKMLRDVAEGRESPAPEIMKPDEGNAHSLGKSAAAAQQRGNEEMDFGFDAKSNANALRFPGHPASPNDAASVVNSGEIQGKVYGSGGTVITGNGGDAVGYSSDYVFVSPSGSAERVLSEKQHGGTVRIDGGSAEPNSEGTDVLHAGVSLSANFGDEQEETKTGSTNADRFHIGATATFGDEQEVADTRQVVIGGTNSIVGEWGSENEAIELQTKAESPKVGQIPAQGSAKTKDRVTRRELPAIAVAPDGPNDLAITSGLRSGTVAIDRETVDSSIRAASFRRAPANMAENSAQKKPFSTFSLHVSDVSFMLAQAALAKGEWPDAERIRIEEFVNAFDYGDPLPSQEEKVAANLEQAAHPFLQQRNLLRVSMRTAATGRNSTTPLRLTFLLDNSGSMERADRRETVQKAFALLASMLQPADQVTLISFARQPRLLADRVSGDQAPGLVETVKNLPSEGGTNLEAALALAFEKAKEQQVPGAQNRIILLTDGAANLGDAEPQRLADKVEQMRNGGIAFDAAGIGTEGLNDEILEALTRKGDGRYYLLDKEDDVDAGFAKKIAGALRPAAGNVKVQIEFNPERVGKYKLLGFEKHRLKKEDFRNDKVDAAELAAAEAGVAVYQVEAKPDGKGDIGSAFVRFRDMATGEMTERRWTIPYQSHPARPAAAAPSMQVATVAAMFGAKLKGDALGEVVDLGALLLIVSGLPELWREKPRVVELKTMLESARAIAGN